MYDPADSNDSAHYDPIKDVPNCHFSLGMNHVSDHFQAVNADVQSELLGLCDRNFSRWALLLNHGQNYQHAYRKWAGTRTSTSGRALKTQQLQNASNHWSRIKLLSGSSLLFLTRGTASKGRADGNLCITEPFQSRTRKHPSRYETSNVKNVDKE